MPLRGSPAVVAVGVSMSSFGEYELNDTEGAILSKPVEEKKALVIENAGNADWRHRARKKNLLPSEAQAAQNGEDVVMVEKDTVSTASGLQMQH